MPHAALRPAAVLARALGRYAEQSRRPLASLLFVAPLLVLYEAGVWWLGPEALRNAADVWLRGGLHLLGLGHPLLLPLLVVAVLLSWQHVSRQRWDCTAAVLCGMVAECALLAALLVAAAQLLVAGIPAAAVLVPSARPAAETASILEHGIASLGAGVYEEALFRLALIPLLAAALARCGAAQPAALAAAATLSSLLFAAAHHLGPTGEPLAWDTFAFRTGAGMVFAAVFVYRGFGIAAVAHAAYDLAVAAMSIAPAAVA